MDELKILVYISGFIVGICYLVTLVSIAIDFVQSRRRRQMTEIEFRGWDWEEILPLFGLEEDYKLQVEQGKNFIEDEKLFISKLKSAICDFPSSHSKEEVKTLVKDLKRFLRKIASFEYGGHYKPFWQGILKVKDESVFLQVFAWNVEYMWT